MVRLNAPSPIIVRATDTILPYQPIWQAMRQWTNNRTPNTPDELWLLQHSPVYTLGQAGLNEHLLRTSEIPLHRTDRGGQITYHGPGQWVAYYLVDIKRAGLTLRTFVHTLEQVMIDVLEALGLAGERLPGAPGVYIHGAKIGALGIRLRRGCSYHGLALNVDMDLSPFRHINPCGYKQLAVTQISDHVPNISLDEIRHRLIQTSQTRLRMRAQEASLFETLEDQQLVPASGLEPPTY